MTSQEIANYDYVCSSIEHKQVCADFLGRLYQRLVPRSVEHGTELAFLNTFFYLLSKLISFLIDDISIVPAIELRESPFVVEHML